jgi:CelD/BcsL family acetyltransferase involved in cellulose biosynthesis
MISSVLESVDALADLRDEWDRLAIEAGRPYATPAWVLAWWQCLRPSNAAPRVIVVQRGEELVGIFPLLAVGHRYRPIGGDLAAVEPLAKQGLEREVAPAIAGAMASLQSRPAMITLQVQDDSADWAGLFSSGWPDRGVWQPPAERVEVPGIDLGSGDFEAWIGAKTSSFRREMRRKAKRLDEAGASFRFASEESLERDVGEFLRLHRTRLSGRGGSSLEADGVDRMLCAVGCELLPLDRFRLLLLEADGKAVGAQVIVAAGTEASAWNSGFDEAYAKLSPSMQCILHAVRDAFEQGRRTMSLGPGEQAYKARLADSSVDLVTHTLVPRGRGYAGARGRIAAASAGRVARTRIGRIVPQSMRRVKGTARREAKL